MQRFAAANETPQLLPQPRNYVLGTVCYVLAVRGAGFVHFNGEANRITPLIDTSLNVRLMLVMLRFTFSAFAMLEHRVSNGRTYN